jgi:uncharacterized protein YgbK (DUF1537 family)
VAPLCYSFCEFFGLAGMLVKHGMRTVQMIGVPHAEPCPADVDAVVIALKSRTSPAFPADLPLVSVFVIGRQ